MWILLLAWLGGVLTIASPCILPVLPFVFAGMGRPFAQRGLPLLTGMALTFAVVASLAAAGANWAVRANQYGRQLALVVLALVGLTLLLPRLATLISRPFLFLGNRVARSDGAAASPWSAFALGVATGLLWAPCAGPILGLLLTSAALHGASVASSLLLLTYAIGAAMALAVVLLAGQALARSVRHVAGAGETLRRTLGVLVLAGVVAIAAGLDTGLLGRLSLATTGTLEQGLVDRLRPAQPVATRAAAAVDGLLPSALAGATGWLNSPPLNAAALRGKVVLVDFWTYSCINCLRSLPHLRAWADRYGTHGLVIIGVHTPEFAFEKDPANVAAAVRRLGVSWPVALDDDYAIWRAFDNRYWPAHYFIDVHGRIRHQHFGEGGYAESEQVIRSLLAEAGHTDLPPAGGQVLATGVEAPADFIAGMSPETYLGYARAERFAGGTLARDRSATYRAPAQLGRHAWALDGRWTVQAEDVRLDSPGGRIVFRFAGRDLHLVLGPGARGGAVRFRVRIDGKPPGADHGSDVDAQGNGVVRTQRLYQLIRQAQGNGPRLFEIEFEDSGVRAYAFTFG